MQLSSKVQKFASVIPTVRTRITPRDGEKARSYFWVRYGGRESRNSYVQTSSGVEDKRSI